MFYYTHEPESDAPQGVIEIEMIQEGIEVKRSSLALPIITALDMLEIDENNEKLLVFGEKNLDDVTTKLRHQLDYVEDQEDCITNNMTIEHKLICDVPDYEWYGITQCFSETAAVVVYQKEVVSVNSDRLREMTIDDREQIWKIVYDLTGVQLQEEADMDFDPRDDPLPGCGKSFFHDSLECYCERKNNVVTIDFFGQ